MRTRRRRQNKTPNQNLDSFLDILTNTVGVLMFISLFVSLIAVEADSIIKTPLVSQSDKKARYFELRENTITYINDEKVDRDIQKLIGNLPNCNRPDFNLSRICNENRARRLINFRTQTEYYNVKMVDARTFSMRYEPIPFKKGETEKEFVLDESKFNQTLANLDPNKDYLAFVVRPDSFKAFRAARELAWSKGFNVGWEPYKSELPIQFGSGGREVKVQ